MKRETVYKILKICDPEGIEGRFGNKLRRREYLSPGPNFLWHLDGYDKLKQFGFAIHGCVDGYSRMIMWLEVASTNNDPKVTAHYCLSTIKEKGFVPTIVRSDKGTENTLTGLLQICLRNKHNDKLSGDKSYVTGKSTRNQRIESFWGRMRQHSMDFYIQFFKCMEAKGLFDGSKLHVHCLQFCFGPLITNDLKLTKDLWNEHHIRKQALRNNVCGKPTVMYYAPEKFGAKDYKKNINKEAIDHLINELTTKPTLIDPLFEEMVDALLPEYSAAKTPEEALALYKQILDSIRRIRL